MRNILLLTILFTFFILNNTIYAQVNKAQKELCNYHIDSKEGKKDRKKLESRIEKLAAQFFNLKKKEGGSDYLAALNAVAHNMKEQDFCVTAAFVVANDYMDPENSSAYTLYLYVSNQKLMGVTFLNKKKIEIDHIFQSKEDYTSFVGYQNMEMETIADYSPLLGEYYNIHYPQQSIALAWDEKMNSMTVAKNAVATYYFSVQEGKTLFTNGFGFWQEYAIKMIPLDNDTILLIHNSGSKKEVVSIYKRKG